MMKKMILILAVMLVVTGSLFAITVDQVTVDPMTDEIITVIAIVSEDVEASIGYRRSSEGTIDLTFNLMSGYLGDKNNTVTLRFDKEDPIDYLGISNTTGTSRFFEGNDVGIVIDKLFNSNRLVARVYDYEGTQYTFIFDTSEFKTYYDKHF